MSALTVTNRQGFAPATITEAIQFSEMLSASAMVPKAYQGKPQDIMVCVQWGYEIGLAPMQALQNIAVINGKPSVYGDAAMALVQASPVCEDVEEYFEGEGTPNPIAVCVAKRKGRKPVVAKFSVEDAKRAGLWGKQGPWSAYPKRMMQMRARGFALRDAFPDVLKGLITAEEAQDYPDEAKPRQAKDITPRNPLDMVAAPAIQAETNDPAVIAAAFAADQEAADVNRLMADAAAADMEVIDIPEVAVAEETVTVVETQQSDRMPGEDDEPVAQTMTVTEGFAVFVPGKDAPASVHGSLDDWQDAYEEMADKIAKAGKRPARERMTILREFKEVNTDTLHRVESVKRLRHTAAYSKRLAALGAAQ
jgi:hypothetical protein